MMARNQESGWLPRMQWAYFLTAVYSSLGHFRDMAFPSREAQPSASDLRIPLGNGLVHNHCKQAK